MWLIYVLIVFNPLNLLENSGDKQNTISVQFIPEWFWHRYITADLRLHPLSRLFLNHYILENGSVPIFWSNSGPIFVPDHSDYAHTCLKMITEPVNEMQLY